MTQAVQLAQYGSNNVGLSFKNRIINGDMGIDQRNAGASVSISSNTYTLDRYRNLASGGGVYSVQQSSNAPVGFTKSLLMTVTTTAASPAAANYYSLRQSIEGLNIADLGWGTANAKTITLSFWVRSSLTGTFGGAVNNDVDASYAFTYTISAANTWEQKSITIVGPTVGTWATDNSLGLNLELALGVGSTRSGTAGIWTYPAAVLISVTGATNVMATNGATLALSGIQFEVGSVATSFDYLPYGTELQLCQRYTWVTNSNSISTAIGNGGTDPWCNVIIPVIMRSTPTLTVTGTLCVSDQVSVDAFAASPTVPNSNLANNGGRVRIAGWGVTLTSNRVFTGTAAGGSGTLTFNAEL